MRRIKSKTLSFQITSRSFRKSNLLKSLNFGRQGNCHQKTYGLKKPHQKANIRHFSTKKDTSASNKNTAKSVAGPTIGSKPELYQYVLSTSLREHPVLKQLRQEKIEPHPIAVMSGSPDQAQFLNFMIKSTQSKKVLEYGVFLGYSTISMALALPPEGKLYGLDTSQEFTDIAKQYLAMIPHLQSKVEIIIGPAKETGNHLLRDHENSFDFIFIDANK